MWQMAEQMGHNVTRETRDYLNRLLQIAVNGADKQFPRIRKEYRMLTEEERARFHKALRALKEDTVWQKQNNIGIVYFTIKNLKDTFIKITFIKRNTCLQIT